MVLGQQYSKIEILQRNGSNINNVNYLNCWYEITNGYFIVSELDLDKESLFPIGSVFSWTGLAGTKWGRVVSPPIVYDAIARVSHIVVLAEAWSPIGTELG